MKQPDDTSTQALTPGRYRHYKGKDYQVLDVATHSETGETVVVYRCLYGDYSLWVRPLSMFTESVEVAGETVPRFAFVAPMEKEDLWAGQ
ncbi:DUF1653 domain-containing protein [Marinimicrobium locisalis]|uniref:DUF1653 domain-containing protein n=1 Tax=Marinimicrobium locisalis TaxID=546022 RepID=UPI00322194A6